MKLSYLKILGSPQHNISETFYEQDQFDDRRQIQQIRFTLKNLYFKKRQLYVNTYIDILQDHKMSIEQARQLKLPNNIQKQREQYFTINDIFEKQRHLISPKYQQPQTSPNQEPFNIIKDKILNKYRLKRKYLEQMKPKFDTQDSLEVEKRIILDIYKNKLKEYYVLDSPNAPQTYYGKRSENLKTFGKAQQKQMERSISPNNQLGQVDKISPNVYGKGFNQIQENSFPDQKQRFQNHKIKQSTVIQGYKNPNTANYMKISDPNLDQSPLNKYIPNHSVGHILNDFVETDRDISLKPIQKKLSHSFQQSGYNHYLLQQKKQLEEQKKRMFQLTEKANKALNNQGYSDSEEEEPQTKSQNFTKTIKNNFEQSLESNSSVSIDESIRQINQVKCLFAELIQHFIMSETLKFQLQNRTFQIISKLYQYASKQYKQKIPLQQPISINTFSIVIKCILSEEYQLKSEVDVVVNKFFKNKNEINFDDIGKGMKSVLNKKQAQMFDSIESKTQLDRTIEKAKRMFVAWISMHYFTQKIRQILRRKSFIVTVILKQCSPSYDSQTFESFLLVDFFFEGCTSTAQRLKVDIFFRQILGKELKRKSFVEWYSNQNMLSSRYERIGLRLSKQKHN